MEPRPFTVIGGFLGAGKTTLLNHILRASEGVRYAVLVNDFGAINIDAGLIAAHDGQTMALTNGCICCSLADGFVATMLRLMAAPERFDHVVVEASGVAEPDRIMDFARADPMLSPDAILVLADAETVERRLADPKIGDVVARQVACADILLLNKTDLAATGALAVLGDRLRGLNPIAPILECRGAALPLSVLLGTGLAADTPRAAADGHADAPFHTAEVTSRAPLTRAAFEAWEEALPATILRGKGRVVLAGEGSFVWQRVGERSTLSPASDPEPAAGTRIVLIAAAPIDVGTLEDRA